MQSTAPHSASTALRRNFSSSHEIEGELLKNHVARVIEQAVWAGRLNGSTAIVTTSVPISTYAACYS
jgi:hypothetical protein